ncbi:MAG: hypothetical protein J6W25_01625 [Bacilli bacterium]|nr:hypothetical protein [Bacilli bacterium]
MKRLKEIKNNELFYNGYSLTALARKYGTPLKITFLDVIKNHIVSLKASFDKAIKKNNYPAKFIYLNANKANYGALEVIEAFKHADGLETSSYYDLLFTHELFNRYPEHKYKYIVCNGYKLDDYIGEIIKIHNEGIKIIDIIDSVSEYVALKKSGLAIEVGMRIHIEAMYSEKEEEIKNDRFGLMDSEIDYILNDIKNTNLTLSTIHFHQRGFDYEEVKFEANFEKVFNKYYIKAAKLYKSVTNFNMGGGTPLPVDEGFDYDKWANYVLNLIMKLCNKEGLLYPNLMSENGKYSQKDATVNIYKVVGIKYTDKYPWHIVDGSLLIAMPEMYALGEPIEVRPINGLDQEMVKGYLAGITCDCDDVYFEKDKGYINLPKIDELYIGLMGTGSYQNSMNGKGGVHHCLLPEEKDLVINDGEVTIRSELQSIEDIYKIMKL